jgi:type II secretory pathway pseudopilin PulG
MMRRRVGNSGRAPAAFTLIELIIAITIIIILAGLVLGTSGYVQKKGKRSRAEAEIAALSAALESYKADNGTYPANAATNSANPTAVSATPPADASLYLYQTLSGNDPNGGSDQKSYFAFTPQMLGGQRTSGANPTTVTHLRDPFGNSYGYSTARNPDANPQAASAAGYNPTFDLWSTADSADPAQWIKNW